jgi:YVTN family beta-propeller protein
MVGGRTRLIIFGIAIVVLLPSAGRPNAYLVYRVKGGDTEQGMALWGGRVYVTDPDSSQIRIHNAVTGALLGSFAAGAYPDYIGVDVQAQRLLVTCENSKEVRVYSLASSPPSFLTSIPIDWPQSIAVDSVARRAYVTVPVTAAPRVAVIDLDALGVVASVPVGAAPLAVALNTSSHLLYVANTNADSVSVVDVAAQPPSVVATIPVGDGPFGISENRTTHLLYTANLYDSTVSIIDTNTRSVVGSISMGGYEPFDVAVDSSRNRIYVALPITSITNGHVNGQVREIDGATRALIHTVDITAGTPARVLVDPANKREYVVAFDEGDLLILNDDSVAPHTYFTAPAAPVFVGGQVRIDLIIQSITVKQGTPVQGTTTDGSSGISRVIVTFTGLDGGPTETRDADLTCNTSLTNCTWKVYPPIIPGRYRVSVSGQDRAGNVESPAQETITVL